MDALFLNTAVRVQENQKQQMILLVSSQLANLVWVYGTLQQEKDGTLTLL